MLIKCMGEIMFYIHENIRIAGLLEAANNNIFLAYFDFTGFKNDMLMC